jgi:hypothetical protein
VIGALLGFAWAIPLTVWLATIFRHRSFAGFPDEFPYDHRLFVVILGRGRFPYPPHCQVYYGYPLRSFPATGFGATGLY